MRFRAEFGLGLAAVIVALGLWSVVGLVLDSLGLVSEHCPKPEHQRCQDQTHARAETRNSNETLGTPAYSEDPKLIPRLCERTRH